MKTIPAIRRLSRREFLASAAAIPALTSIARPNVLAPQPSHLPAYLSLKEFIEPGLDDFPEELQAQTIRSKLHQALNTSELANGEIATGISPMAAHFEEIAPDLKSAIFDSTNTAVGDGWRSWVASLGTVRRAEFYPLPNDIVRFEVASHRDGKLLYRTGQWKQTWQSGKLIAFSPLYEHICSAAEPLFRDVTAAAFSSAPLCEMQFRRGVPYWRARLDPASGIDIYGSNGIAVGDIDCDGADEIYVCQPGGLPNRLLKLDGQGKFLDITDGWGAGILDDTSTALFLDLRNCGRQDLVVLRSGGPILLLNEGRRFKLRDDAFQFSSGPKGGFTGMAAADFDRDGRLDLYLCCYVYFQSEAQYTYAAPYHDAQNGPPNFLFRNRLTASGEGFFEDCTVETGMDENNNRFSFAPSWCDFNDDGWPDLYVANDFGRKNLYVNKGARFSDRAKQAGVEDTGPGMSASWFDYDGDGRPDLYVANMWSDAGQRIVQGEKFEPAKSESEAYRRHTKGNSLYRNRGDETFEDASAAQQVEFGRWAWSSGGHDVDNDGHAEILVACGMLTNSSSTDLMSFFWRQVVAKSPLTAQASSVYQNGWNALNQFIREDYSWEGHEPNVIHVRRGDRYYDFSGISGFDFAQDGRAFAVFDFDDDGRPDILLKSRLGPQVRLLQNNCASTNHSIAFQLRGVKSNRDAIGARVEVDGQTKWLEAGSGFLSQHSKRMLFGLGQSEHVKLVRITWPSGEKEEYRDLKAGNTYFLVEGENQSARERFRAYASLPSQAPAAENDLALNDTWFLEPIPLPERQRGPGLLVLIDGAESPEFALPDVTILDLSRRTREQFQYYEIFRRYLFDWRTSLVMPLAFLLNESGEAIKVYARPPSSKLYGDDLARMRDHARLALPFPGKYVVQPRRDFFKLGAAFLWAGYPGQALPYLEQVLSRTPDNARVLVLAGQIHLDQGNLPKAEAYFRHALAQEPRLAEAAYGLGLAQAKQTRFEDALTSLKLAISERPDYADAINDLGALYMQEGKPNDAIAAFQYGVRVAPDEDILYLNLGRTYTSLGQFEKARQVMQQLLDRKPGSETAQKALRQLSER